MVCGESAYRQLHSAATALVKIVDDMLAAMDRGHAVTVVGLDMSSAFDAVCHHTLIDRLQSDFGVPHGTCLQWITSYLAERPSSVCVNSTACAIIGSRLDYCNSLYYGMSNMNFQRLQRVQNAAARIVCQAPR